MGSVWYESVCFVLFLGYFSGEMLGSELSGLLLDSAHPRGSHIRPHVLPCGFRVSRAGRRWQHDPCVEHADHSEPVRYQVLLAGHQVQGHSGETFFFFFFLFSFLNRKTSVSGDWFVGVLMPRNFKCSPVSFTVSFKYHPDIIWAAGTVNCVQRLLCLIPTFAFSHKITST